MDQQIIWITGASSGIGEALAINYSKKGYKLILSARNQQKLEEVKSKCAYPENVRILNLDLNNMQSLPYKVDEAWNIFGKIDILINSGGVSQRGLGLNTSLKTELEIMNVNFWGSVVLSKALINKMIPLKSGQIVCISSLVGKFGTKFRSTYSASKHALHGYFDSLRAELFESGIKFTIIRPGFIRTDVSINALTESGNKQGTMDDAQDNGMLPDVFAKKAISAISKHKEEVYIGGKEVLGVYLKRWVPLFFSKFMRKAKVV